MFTVFVFFSLVMSEFFGEIFTKIHIKLRIKNKKLFLEAFYMCEYIIGEFSMKIRNLILAGITATSMNACKKPLTEAKHVEPFVQECVDTIASYSKSVLNDPAYKCFGKDTLALGKDFSTHPEKFVKEMRDSAASNVPTRLVDSKFVLISTPFGREAKCHEIRKPIYENTEAVIVSPKIFTDGSKNYVPVEYYGK